MRIAFWRAKTHKASEITEGRFGKSRLEWATDRLLKGAGTGADPIEITVPAPGVITSHKTADQTVNNSAVFVNDNHLLFAMAANEVFAVTILPFHDSTDVADIKFGFALPVGAKLYGLAPSRDNVNNDVNAPIIETSSLIINGFAADYMTGFIQLVVVNGGNAGNFQLQFAQGVAEVSNTILRENSCMIIYQLV